MQYARKRTYQGTEKNVQRDFYTYIAEVDSISAGETKEVSINIEADSSFIWLKSTYDVDNGLTANPDTIIIPTVKLQIRDTGAGRLLFQRPIKLRHIAGDGELPYLQGLERVFDPKATINLTFTNTNTVDAYTNLTFVMHGYKEWPL